MVQYNYGLHQPRRGPMSPSQVTSRSCCNYLRRRKVWRRILSLIIIVGVIILMNGKEFWLLESSSTTIQMLDKELMLGRQSLETKHQITTIVDNDDNNNNNMTAITIQSVSSSSSPHWKPSDCPPAPLLKPYDNVTTTTTTTLGGSLYHQNQNYQNQHHPIWVASYPGSGSELFRKLIIALTGLDGANWYDTPNRCNHYPATCKTHCPFLQKEHCPRTKQKTKLSTKTTNKKKKKRKQNDSVYNNSSSVTTLSRADLDENDGNGNSMKDDNNNNNGNDYFHDTVILLVRNPKNAISSYINWRWESRRGIDTHTQQAPIEFWKVQRNVEFDNLLNGWKQILYWWTIPGKRQSIYNVSLIIPYEQFISIHHGPQLLSQLVIELQKANIPIQIPYNQLSCLWYTIVHAPKSTTKRIGHHYQPSYTKEQQQKMMLKLNDVIETFSSSLELSTTTTTTTTTETPVSNRIDLVTILKGYQEDIIQNMVIDEEE